MGPGTEYAGRLGVLRVLVSHPATPDPDTLENVADADSNHHLVATVDLPSLARWYSETKILESLKGRIVASTISGSRRNSDEVRDPSNLESEDSSSLDEDEDPSTTHADKRRRFK